MGTGGGWTWEQGGRAEGEGSAVVTWQRGVWSMTWRAMRWQNDEAEGQKLRPGAKRDGTSPRASKMRQAREQERDEGWVRPEGEVKGEFWTPEVFRAQGS